MSHVVPLIVVLPVVFACTSAPPVLPVSAKTSSAHANINESNEGNGGLSSVAKPDKPAAAIAPDNALLLVPIASRTAIERKLERYFQAHDVESDYRERTGDGWLEIPYESDGLEWTIRVGTDSVADDGSEQVIWVSLETDYTVVGTANATRVLEAINAYHNDNWGGTFYIDPNDREITGQWHVKVTRAGIHPDIVLRAVSGLGASWVHLHNMLQKSYQQTSASRGVANGSNRIATR